MPPRSRKPPRELLRRIRLVVLDVDGTLTDGRLFYGKDGEALKAFDVRDGHGLRLLQLHGGIKVAALTGRRADLVQQRQICDEVAVPLADTAFMGDDVNDLPALRIAALSCAPADAAPEVLREVRWVAPHRAGRGAVRALCELLLAATVGWPPPEDAPAPRG